MKSLHESWVHKTLSDLDEGPLRVTAAPDSKPDRLLWIRDGHELLPFLSTYGLLPSYEKPTDAEQAELVASFIGEVSDWMDILDDLPAGDEVRVAERLTERIVELVESGFFVFAAKEIRRLQGLGKPPDPWPLTHLTIMRASTALEQWAEAPDAQDPKEPGNGNNGPDSA